MNKYQSYKPSGVEWIGEIPNEWSTKRLIYSFKIQKGKIPSELLDEPIVNGLPYLSMDVLRGNEPTEFSIDKNIVEVKDGDIGILWDGSNSGEIIKINRNGILSSTVSLLTIIDQGLNKEFGYYLLKLFENDFKSNTTGMGIPHVNGNYVRETKLIIPPILEQLQIVQFLDEKTELIDKLISTKERKITLLKEQRTSLINEVVTKGLNPNVKMKDSGIEWIGEIPEHWLLISLHKLLQTNRLDFQDGNHGGEYPNPEEFIKNGVPFIKPRDIQDGKVEWLDCDRLPFERTTKFRIGFSNNDDVLLVNRGGSIGKVCYVTDYDNEYPYFIINPQVTYLRGKNGLSSKYVFYITKSDVFRCGVDLVLGHGSTFPFLGLSNMSDFKMVLPPFEEQNKIIEYLDSKTKEIDDLVQLEQKKIDLLKEYRQSLISEVVTGKIKVTQ